MSTPLLLFVESNTTGTGRQFAQRARALGAEPVLLSADPARYPYAAQDGLRTVVVDTADDDALWTASWNLNNTFLRGRDCGTVANTCTRDGTRDVRDHVDRDGIRRAVRRLRRAGRRSRSTAPARTPLPHGRSGADPRAATEPSGQL